MLAPKAAAQGQHDITAASIACDHVLCFASFARNLLAALVSSAFIEHLTAALSLAPVGRCSNMGQPLLPLLRRCWRHLPRRASCFLLPLTGTRQDCTVQGPLGMLAMRCCLVMRDGCLLLAAGCRAPWPGHATPDGRISVGPPRRRPCQQRGPAEPTCQPGQAVHHLRRCPWHGGLCCGGQDGEPAAVCPGVCQAPPPAGSPPSSLQHQAKPLSITRSTGCHPVAAAGKPPGAGYAAAAAAGWPECCSNSAARGC